MESLKGPSTTTCALVGKQCPTVPNSWSKAASNSEEDMLVKARFIFALGSRLCLYGAAYAFFLLRRSSMQAMRVLMFLNTVVARLCLNGSALIDLLDVACGR